MSKSKKYKNAQLRCYNCIFAGIQFKISNMTYLHCGDESQYSEQKFLDGEISEWDSLKKFSDSCENHQSKTPSESPNGSKINK